MIIRKTQQPSDYPSNSISNAKTTGTTNTYSCDYINGIVESGSNANGNWIKFSDGTMICTGTKYVGELTLTEHGGGIYKSQDISLPNFPIEFTTLYTCQLSYWYATWASTPVISVIHWGYPTTISAGIAKILCATNDKNNGGYIKILAIGKWK